jgi:hypothetical protein
MVPAGGVINTHRLNFRLFVMVFVQHRVVYYILGVCFTDRLTC